MSPLPAGLSPVALLQWPTEAALRAELATAGRPRLLLVEADAPPPRTWDPAEDWVRLPVDQAEVESRISAILRRCGRLAAGSEFGSESGPVPVLDGDGVLHVGGRRVSLPAIEAALAALLLQRVGTAVTRAELAAAGWPGGEGRRELLDGRIKLLRRRLGPLGIRIHTLRGTGYLLSS